MRLPSLNIQILIGAVLGVLIGLYFQGLGAENSLVKNGVYVSTLVGTLFIDLLKMILIPLVFCSIAVGIANLRQHSQIHRVWVSTMVFFMFTMAIAITLGMLASNYFKPGAGLEIAMFQGAMQSFQAQQMPLADFFAQFLHGLFVNPFKALAEGNVIAVVLFALFLGIALVMGGDRYKNILNLMQEGLEITMRIVGWIMVFAPFGIAALLIKLVATQDVAMIGTMAKFMAVVVGTTLVHGVVILPLLLYLITGKTPLWFWCGAREALVTAFATSSSNATLPITMRCTTLYEAAAALFIANLVGIELNLTQQFIVFVTAMIAAVGAPGIPSAGMVTMVMVLQSVGLPAEAIAILLPIDRLLDTLRTTVNVQGDMIGSLVVQKLASTKLNV
jgi:Na+/H+-dicarboxylate symporter